MKRIIFSVLALLVILTACAPASTKPSNLTIANAIVVIDTINDVYLTDASQ